MNRNLRRLSRPESIVATTAIVFLFVLFAAIPTVQAGIVGVPSGVIVTTPPPGGVNPTASPTQAGPIIFLEILNGVVPGGGMPVDHVVTGNATATPVVSGNIVDANLIHGSLNPGDAYESYFFHFDPGTGVPVYPAVDIVFSNKILGVQLFSTGDTALQKPALTPYIGRLENGDGIAFPGAYYPSGLGTRGIESGDSLQIASGGFELKLAGQAFGGEIDQIRIFVSVPEPTSLAIAFVAILGIMGLSRTRSKAARL